MEENIYITNLYDCYGELLTDKQKEYFLDYYFDNLTLSEIADNNSVSRNAIHKQLKEAENKYGDSKCITISTKGICIICEYGICYYNIPAQLAKHLKTSKNHPDFITYTDSGTYFMSNEDGWYEYNIR